jgi:hypothetical protein
MRYADRRALEAAAIELRRTIAKMEKATDLKYLALEKIEKELKEDAYNQSTRDEGSEEGEAQVQGTCADGLPAEAWRGAAAVLRGSEEAQLG